MNEKFKCYTDEGFEFEIGDLNGALFVLVNHEGATRPVYIGGNLDHAFAACDLWLLGEGQ